MIISGAKMNVTPDLVGIAPNNEHRFAMRFQSDHAVNDVRARFLEPPSPLNVGRFIKARAQFHDRDHLFAGRGGVDQRLNNRRIATRPVQRDLERKDLRIARGFFDKIDNRFEAVVRMMQEHVLTPHHFEHVRVRRERRIASG